ncbi:hypothetical protein PHLCEN_2v3227, partial [Hermanssonia centrifuga]
MTTVQSTTSLPCDNKTHCYDADDLKDRYLAPDPDTGKETWTACREKICINRYTFPHYTERNKDPWAKTPDPNQIRLIVEEHGLSDELRREVEEELARRIRLSRPSTTPAQPKASSSSSTRATPTTQPIASSSTTQAVPASTTPKPQTPRPSQIPITRSASGSGQPTQQPIAQQQQPPPPPNPPSPPPPTT